jgi:hypothetical protein
MKLGKSSVSRAAAGALSMLVVATSSIAATYTWSGATGGTWNSSNTNWTDAPADPWTEENGVDNLARFNSSGHNVEVSGNVFANGLDFAAGATLRNTGTINLVGTSPTMAIAANSTISAKLGPPMWSWVRNSE